MKGRKIIIILLLSILLVVSVLIPLVPVEAQEQEWELVERGENFIRYRSLIDLDQFSWESQPQWIYNGSDHQL